MIENRTHPYIKQKEYFMNKKYIKVTLLRLFYLNKAGCFLKKQKNFKAKWEFNINMYLYSPLPINDLCG